MQTAERNIRIKLHEKGLVAKYRFSDILGQSPAILEAKRLSENFADSQFTVMLYGETGTGKEMFAQSIPQVINSSMTILVTFLGMLFTNALLTVVVLVCVCFALVVTRFLAGRSGRYFLRQQSTLGASTVISRR